ncbi:MAG: J domain-containing protein [Pseudoxanthomonas sp.]
MTNYYDILQVMRGASQDVIRASYYALSERFRPGGNEPREEAERMTLLLNEAFATLIDPAKRAKYDSTLDEVFASPPQASPPQPSAPSSVHASSIHKSPNLETKVESTAASTWSWWYMLPMFVFLGAFGKFGLIGVAIGAFVWWLGYKLWDKFGSAGKIGLSLAGFGIAFVVFAAAMEIKSEARRSKAPIAATPSTAISAPAAGEMSDEEVFGTSTASSQETMHVGKQRSLDDIYNETMAQTAWNSRIQSWEAMHVDFLSDPARKQAMAQALDEIAAAEPNISDEDLIRRAQYLAFTRTGWR